MAFVFPVLITKDTNLEQLDDKMVLYWHEKMQVLWSKIEDGLEIPEWDFKEIYERHKKLLKIMKERGIKHICPINSLDIVKEE